MEKIILKKSGFLLSIMLSLSPREVNYTAELIFKLRSYNAWRENVTNDSDPVLWF